MICLLLEDMPEGEVKDMVKPDVHHRASAQVNFVESQMQSNDSHFILSSPNSHAYLPANNLSPLCTSSFNLDSTFSS